MFTQQSLPDSGEVFDDPVGQVSGFSLHAGVAAKAHQRQKLERLCRYISRPAVSEQRLSLTPNGNVRYQLKTPYRDGITHVIFEPLDFIARLAALVPKPRGNLTHFHGVFAPNSRDRAAVTPAKRGKGAKPKAIEESTGENAVATPSHNDPGPSQAQALVAAPHARAKSLPFDCPDFGLNGRSRWRVNDHPRMVKAGSDEPVLPVGRGETHTFVGKRRYARKGSRAASAVSGMQRQLNPRSHEHLRARSITTYKPYSARRTATNSSLRRFAGQLFTFST